MPAARFDGLPGLLMTVPHLQIGRPWPLGTSVQPGGVNLAVFSAHATAIEWCLFDGSGRTEKHRLRLPGRTGDVWHGFLPDAGAGLIYGLRAHGPYEPGQGQRFNPHKLLLDPYARALQGELIWNDALYGFVRGHADADLSFDTRDSASFVPRTVVIEPADETPPSRPDTPWCDTSILEAHARGLTQQHPQVNADVRGTYAGVTDPAMLEHYRQLGITALELLPVHEFIDDHFLEEAQLSNYWGYNTLCFLATARRYARGQKPGDAMAEFRTMAESLHEAGIELLLDVVYNHSAEGTELGPTLCYRGLDNASYYRLDANRRFYVNDAGTGNTLNVAHPQVLQLVMDSLRHWVSAGVDGFRFDLASVLGREAHGFDRGAGFFDATAQEPDLAGIKLIAEPWDIGPGGYQLGQYPPQWSEWNDRYRDTVRRFWAGEPGTLAGLSAVIMGSSELFEWQGRAPRASVNFITAHDGFTLADLVSYEHKHNHANGENNRDGHDTNHSWNHGVEGPSERPRIVSARQRSQRNLLATLLLSQGVPMLLAGDSHGNSQRGNNNAYCQNNSIGWVDPPVDDALERFVARLVCLRAQHPALRRNSWLHGQNRSAGFGVPDVSWLGVDGEPMHASLWQQPENRFVALLLPGDAIDPQAVVPDPEPVEGYCLLIVINGGHRNVPLPLQSPALALGGWSVLIDTANPEDAEHGVADTLLVHAHSLVVARCYTGDTGFIDTVRI